jgi:large subunit ribosomal protein L22
MTMKRISPAPMGRAFRIRKRSNHVTIVVASVEGKHARPAKETKKPAKESKSAKGGAKQKAAAGTK